MSKVSIIIPVYNSEQYLIKCLNSARNQTLRDIEIICINDCSTDNSLGILNEYARKDNRIKVIDLKENKGASYARNKAMDIAQGEYIGFLDSDDFIDLDFYEKLYRKAIETDADAVKGELWEINNNKLKPQMVMNYDLNSLIKKDYVWFYFTFTTAIYKRSFLIENDIKFPIGLCHMEDNYFTIKAILNYKKLEIVEGAKYYYVLTPDTREKKQDITETIKSIEKAVKIILELINSSDIRKEQYQILFSFILKQVKDYCEVYKNADFYQDLLSIINYISDNCKYKSEMLSSFMEYQKTIESNHEQCKNERLDNEEKKSEVNALGNNLLFQYNKYSKYLTNSKIKILVSYIKPSFLFKSDIFVPIHLGRAVAKENSKDGIMSDEKIKWLYDNCIGDDDFEENISKVNRRVGFLTGTWWAYNNYEKLGNPDYFGFFAHRRILDPKLLYRIEDCDLILPEKAHPEPNIETQFSMSHSKRQWELIKETIKKVHPEDYFPFIQFGCKQYAHFFEMYIMKKELFFDFCKWIFPILFELLSITEEKMVFSEIERQEILDWFKYHANPNECNEKNFDVYQKRGLGFMIERITAYYFDKLISNPNIKYLEAETLMVKEEVNPIDILRNRLIKK